MTKLQISARKTGLFQAVQCAHVAMAKEMDNGDSDDVFVALLELIALAALCDTSDEVPPRQSQLDPVDVSELDDGYAELLVQLARQVMTSGMIMATFAAPLSDAYDWVSHLSTSREISIRSPIYHGKLRETLLGLFSAAPVESDLKEVVGFTIAQAIDVMESLVLIRNDNVAARFRQIGALLNLTELTDARAIITSEPDTQVKFFDRLASRWGRRPRSATSEPSKSK